MYTNGFLDCPRRKKKGRKNICQLFILFPKTGQHFSSGTWKLFDLLLFGRDWKKKATHTSFVGGGAIKLLLWTLGHFSLFFVNTGRKNPERERGKRTRAFFKKGSSRRPTHSVKLFFRPIELTLVLLWRNSQTERVASIKVTSPPEKTRE